MSEQDLFRIESPALDCQVLGQIELLGDVTGVDLVGQLSVQFLADARSRVAELHQAIVAGDGEVLVRSAHSLSGASATFGATGLSRLCAALEARGGSLSPLLGLRFLEAIDSELKRVQVAFGARVHVAICDRSNYRFGGRGAQAEASSEPSMGIWGDVGEEQVVAAGETAQPGKCLDQVDIGTL